MAAKKRLLYVDVFRGLAIVLMVFLNVFDYVSVYDVHVDEPFYVRLFDSVTILPPILLFAFVSGMSALLLTNSLAKKVGSFASFAKRAVLKYGKYFLLSIPFTLFMWGAQTFYRWEEAIQGLSVSSIITCFVLYRVKDKKKLLALAVLIYLLQSFLLANWRADNSVGVAGFFLNMLFRGWFSISNLVPFMLVGAVFLENFADGKVKNNLLLSMAALIATILLWNYSPVDYYMRSFSLIFYVSALCGGVTSLFYFLVEHFFRFPILAVFGRVAFEVYILHFLFAKMLRIIGFGDLMLFLPAAILSFVVVCIFALIGTYYATKVKGFTV